MIFTVSAPLIPLLPDGEHYPKDFTLPKRQRNEDALDIKRLITIFRKSLVYEEKSTIIVNKKNNTNKTNKTTSETDNQNINNDNIQSDLAVLGVLSPYSLLPHVMIMEMSENRYLPGPESFSEAEWQKVADLAKRVVISMKNLNDIQQKDHENKKYQYAAQCCGFNWSPFAWGSLEEKMSCQSIISKFHMMIWQWSSLALNNNIDHEVHIPPNKQQFFFKNEYNAIFAQLVLNELGISAKSPVNCGPRGLFIPFDLLILKNDEIPQKGIEENIKKMRYIAIVVEKIIMHLNQCLTNDSPEKLIEILEKTSQRNLTKDELNILRKNPVIKPLDEALSNCSNELERKLIKLIYPAAQNRANFTTVETYNHHPEETWMKGFGFSMVMCESKIEKVVKSGLYICLKAMCGSGGVAETLGCYLTRPEDSLASDHVMINHNHSIWTIKKDLEKKKND